MPDVLEAQGSAKHGTAAREAKSKHASKRCAPCNSKARPFSCACTHNGQGPSAAPTDHPWGNGAMPLHPPAALARSRCARLLDVRPPLRRLALSRGPSPADMDPTTDRRYIRAIVRQVHPDLFAAYPYERSKNSDSLKVGKGLLWARGPSRGGGRGGRGSAVAAGSVRRPCGAGRVGVARRTRIDCNASRGFAPLLDDAVHEKSNCGYVSSLRD